MRWKATGMGMSSTSAPGIVGLGTLGVLIPSLALGCPRPAWGSLGRGMPTTPPSPPYAVPLFRLGRATPAGRRLWPAAGPVECPAQRQGPYRLPGWLRKGRRHKLIPLEHSYVQLWVLEAYHKWWPLPQRQGRKSLQPRLGGRVCPGFEEGEDSGKPGYAQIGCCCRHPGHGVARHGGIFGGMAGLGPGWCRRISGVGWPSCRSCGTCLACLRRLSKRGRGTIS